MALLDAHGFEGITTLSELMNVYVGNPTLDTTQSHTGTKSLKAFGGANAMYVNRAIPTGPVTSAILGFAFRLGSFPGHNIVLGGLQTAANGTWQWELRVNTSGQLLFCRNGTVLATYATPLVANRWYYVEAKVTINTSTGSYEVKLDGSTVLGPTTGVNTAGNGGTTAPQLQFFEWGDPGINIWIDDFYICDTSGSVNNTFLGEIGIATLTPSGAGTHTDFTPSAGANYTCVDEIPNNGDTDYVSSNTVNNIDTYAFSDLPGGASVIKGVIVDAYVRKDDVGTRTLGIVARTGATDYVSTDAPVSIGYALQRKVWETNPNTAVAWTATEVNGAEFGVKVVS